MKAWLDELAVHAAGMRLRTGIPLLMICFALAVSLAVALRIAAEEGREVEAAGLEQLVQRAIRLQSMLETYYRNRLEDNAQDAVAQTGTQMGHRLAAVIDERQAMPSVNTGGCSSSHTSSGVSAPRSSVKRCMARHVGS